MDEARLRRVERSQRLLWAAWAGTVAVALAAGARGVPRRLEAREFHVVDDAGESRAILAAGAGSASLTMTDGRGEVRVTIAATDRGSGLVGVSGPGSRAANLYAPADGGQPGVEVIGPGEKVLGRLPAR